MNFKYIVFFAGVLTGAAVIRFIFWPQVTEIETVVTEREVVTVEVLKVDTVIIVKGPEPVTVAPSTEPARYDSARTYSGSVPHEYGRFDWTARTEGALTDLSFKPFLTIPKTTIEKYRDSKTTKTMQARGFYAGAVAGSAFNPAPSVALTINKILITYEYQPLTGQHRAGLFAKIF